MFGYLAAALIGALAMFFLDPERGAYRRNVTRDRTAGTARDVGAQAERAGRRAGAEAYGAKEKLAHLNTERPPESDAVLVDKVRSEVLRDSGIPKGDVLFDVVDGVVTLRGQVERPDIIEELEARVRRVYGVRDVANLLHLPGTPAPRR